MANAVEVVKQAANTGLKIFENPKTSAILFGISVSCAGIFLIETIREMSRRKQLEDFINDEIHNYELYISFKEGYATALEDILEDIEE